MSKAVRTTLSLVFSLMLFSSMALAHASGNHAGKDKSKNNEHHSRLAKVAFGGITSGLLVGETRKRNSMPGE